MTAVVLVVFSAIDVDSFDKLLETLVVSLVPLVALLKILDFDGNSVTFGEMIVVFSGEICLG